ncbi:MAG: PAS domain S-box protein [Dehalococcoidia bacterium]|jgi:PAS domain-containing protein
MAGTTYYAIALVVTIAVALTLAGVAWRRRSIPGGTYFALMMLSGAWWAFAYAMEALTKDQSQKIIWVQVSNLGDGTMPVFFMLFALSYWRPDISIRLQYQILIWLIPVATIIIALTNGLHGFLWSEITPSVEDPNILVYEHGPWFYVSMTYYYLTLWIGVVFLFRAATSLSRIYRRQALVVLVAAVLPWIVNALFLLGFSPVLGMDMAPIAGAATGLLLAFGIMKFQLFKVLPIAKEVVYKQIENGVLIVNYQGIVVDVNPAAKNMLGADVEVGQNLEEVLKNRLKIPLPLPSVHQRTEASLNDREKPLWLDVVIAPLFDRRNQLSGHLIMLHDISDRKSVEDLLRHSEERYRLLAENATDVIWTTNINMQLTYISPSVRRLLGYTVEEAMALPMTEVYTPASVTAIIDVLKEEMALEQTGLADPKRSRMVELELYRKDGSIVPVETNFSIVHDAAGKNVGTLAIARDITARRWAEEALRESERKYRSLTEKMNDIVWIMGLDLRITYVSPSVFKALGFTPEEHMKRQIQDQLTPESLQTVIQTWTTELEQDGKKGLDPNRTAALELEYYRKDGSTVWMENVVSALRDDQGKPVGLHGVSRDITERKRAEDGLKKSEGQVRLLLNSTAEAIYGIDLQGNCTFANPSCAKMLGYANQEALLGKNMHRLIHHSYNDGRPMPVEVCRIYQAFREGKGVHADDEVLWRADGTCFSAEYWSYPQRVGDKVYGAVVTFVDITERRKAEAELVTERRRLADILRGTHVGTWEWNVQTGETVFNERWAEIIGYTLEELSPVDIETWAKFGHPDDLKRSGELLEKHFSGELDYYECEARMRHKDGRWIWVLDRGRVHTWTDDGKPLHMSGTHQDITERKLMEEVLRASEEKLRLTFESIADGIIVIDLAGKVVDVNESTVRIGGYENKSQLIGRDAFDLLAPKDRKLAMDDLRDRQEGRPKERVEYSIYPKDGRAFEGELTASTLRDENGNPVGYIAVVRDITERKRAEEELRKSEKKYRTLFDDSIDAVLISTVDGKILDCNDAMSTLTLYRRDELLGLNALRLYVNPADRENFVREIQKTGAVKEYGVKWLRKDGSEVDVVMTLTARRDADGNIAGYQGIVRDVTERKKIEQMKTDFVSFISHQLRTPTAGLMGYIDNMLDGVTGKLNNRQVEYLNEMRDVCARNNRLIADLLNVSRLERGVLAVNIQPLDLRSAVDIAVKEYRKDIKEKGLSLNIRGMDRDIIVLADTDKLVEVLKNVIHNASKFTSKGSIDIELTTEGRHGIVKISDTGKGMSEKALQDLFKKERVFGGAVAVGGGAGLGLYIAKGFMHLQHGDITAESVEGRGSTFTINVPKK